MKALDQKLVRDLSKMKGQVIAVGLVVACGVATFIAARTGYESMLASQQDYYREFGFADVFLSLKRAPELVARKVERLPGVDVVQTRIVMDVSLDVPGLAEPATGRLVSIPERSQPRLNRIHIRRGRYIEAGQRNEVLVSESFSEANGLHVGDNLGAILNGRWEELKIVGIALSPEYIYEIRGGATIFPDKRRFGILWAGRDLLGPAFDMDGAFNDLSLTLRRNANLDEVLDELDELFERYGGLGAHGRRDQLSNQFITNELAELTAEGRILPAIFLGVAAFLLHVVLSRLISTERDQIAVLKAFGYSDAAVGLHYLKLVLSIVACGGALGIALGVWLGGAISTMYAEFFRFPVYAYSSAEKQAILGILVTVAAAVVGALTAVSSAVRLPPAEGMRPEPPARFRAGLWERVGLQRHFSVSNRIILRNVERRPGRTLLSILAISLAVMILVVGRYFLDAVEALVDIHFRVVQREQVSILFNQPQPARARFELSRLRGVMRSEAFRAVPVRLVFEHRKRRSALLGLMRDGELRRLVDRDLHQKSLPTEGIVLTSFLAESLGARVGDEIFVEVLEGERPVRLIPITATVDELLGEAAYMERGALNRLLREGGSISGAFLSVDPSESSRLYALLKAMPAVSGVSLREATLRSFDETLGRTLGVFTTVLVLFATVIAFGVVYNGARVALSERGRELASLRVLGFTRREVTWMLLGEQASIILSAVPVGCAIGYGVCALLTLAYTTELFRLPLVVTPKTYAFAFVIIALAALISGFIVRRRIYALDLVAVLKTRE
jgi:putative ABC transport system permease protein